MLALAQRAGLVKLGHVALDGTKLRANASKHKAMSYGRLRAEEQRLAAEVAARLQQAEAADTADDARYGPDASGDEVPAELRRREDPLRKIREAKAALEAEAQVRTDAEREAQRAHPPRRGPRPKPPQDAPRDRDQYNFADPESRIVKMADGAFAQAYNVQVAVDRAHQLIGATTVTAQAADAPHLPAIVDALRRQLHTVPRRLTADAGYFSEANLQTLYTAGIEALIPPEKLKHTQSSPPAPRGRIPTACSLKDRMQRKLQTKTGRAVYRQHKAIAEPVVGQIKAARSFRGFLLRGLAKVLEEWRLVAAVHNICKLFQIHTGLPQSVPIG